MNYLTIKSKGVSYILDIFKAKSNLWGGKNY